MYCPDCEWYAPDGPVPAVPDDLCPKCGELLKEFRVTPQH